MIVKTSRTSAIVDTAYRDPALLSDDGIRKMLLALVKTVERN